MLNNISHRLPPYRGVVNFIWAQLYTVVNTPSLALTRVFDFCFQKRRASLTMPPEKCLRLNNQEGLPPCSNGLYQKHQQDAIPLGAHGSFALSTKDDELLA